MNLTVLRHKSEPDRLLGELMIDGEHFCYTLEPPIKTDGSKPRAINDGTYDLINAFSPKHGHDVPHVEDVPDFEDVEIHPGNSPQDTLACLLVGEAIEHDFLVRSRAAFSALMQRLVPVWQSGEKVMIEYKTVLQGDSN